MTTKNITVIILTFITLVSCDKNSSDKAVANFKNGMQIPYIDSTMHDIKVLTVDSVKAGQEYMARIWLTTKSKKLLKSFADADFKSSLIDTTNKTINNCKYKLLIDNDTTYFAVTSTDSVNTNLFFKVALLSVDKDKVYYLHTVDLKFSIKK